MMDTVNKDLYERLDVLVTHVDDPTEFADTLMRLVGMTVEHYNGGRLAAFDPDMSREGRVVAIRWLRANGYMP